MRGPGLWERLLILDEDPGWSILPPVAIGRRTVVACQTAWAGIAGYSYLVRGVGEFGVSGFYLLLCWLLGAGCLDYIIRRVRRVPAQLGSVTVNPGSHFLGRMVMDAIVLVLLLEVMIELLLGVGGVRFLAGLLSA